MDQLIGKEVDNYKILEVIGRGGMGVVFKAIDMNLEKVVALKMIDPFLARDDNFLQRFKTEARALARLENQNIVGVHALRETEYGLFMVMEYVSARTISEWLREKSRFRVNETIAIGSQIINAIGHAHKVGVIHRDIKPNNVLLCDDGTIKVMDFGLAKVVQEQGSQITVTHAAAGTLYYMSPEQVKGLKNVDTRSDIYSLGMTLYEMLAGRTPFEKSESEFVIQKQIVEGRIPSPTKFNPLIPKELVKVILKSIDKDPDKRYQSAAEMSSALNNIKLEGDDTEEKTRIITSYETEKETAKAGKPPVRKMYIYGAGILAIAIILAAFFITRNNGVDPIPPKIVKFVPVNLSINSVPDGALVYLNGMAEGKTPFQRDSLPLAKYSVALKLEGYKDWENPGVQLDSGNNELNVQLEPVVIPKAKATLILNSIPASSIYIDGSRVLNNSSEILRNTVTAGKHTVKFVHPEFGTKRVNVDLGKNQNKKITCYFQQQVNIQSLSSTGDPIWGVIYINGKNTDKTTPGDLKLGPGTYQITVKKTGYKTVEDEVRLTVNPTFEPRSHSLVFHFK